MAALRLARCWILCWAVATASWRPACLGLNDCADPAPGNATALLLDAQVMIGSAPVAVLATHAMGSAQSLSASPADINARVVLPSPLLAVTNASSLGVVYIDTNSFSRKYQEIQVALASGHAARANLLHYDRDGDGYVALRGNATFCSAAEAVQIWWEGWRPYYPDGPSTPNYAVIRFEPDWLEIVSAGRYNVSSGRADWRPVSLRRSAGQWSVEVPAVPSPPPGPSPPSPSSGSWRCNVCQHVYDPEVDGGGVPFEKLPSSYKCPVCQAPKSAFKKQLADGVERWVHEEPQQEGSLQV
ncbi:unnamed protein product [Polarella glacialis]|uniref:Rubredoxin-like domain-containing protein n=1 Tax=Polarella glacialis TaxID=89957 RepID=A0A813L2M1_POLGL|nr:unnamed protein product [Polarella glacialis]CAE8719308.1 unnamed protein product [Polarella glacialis]